MEHCAERMVEIEEISVFGLAEPNLDLSAFIDVQTEQVWRTRQEFPQHWHPPLVRPHDRLDLPCDLLQRLFGLVSPVQLGQYLDLTNLRSKKLSAGIDELEQGMCMHAS